MRLNLKERVPITGDTHLKPPQRRRHSILFDPLEAFLMGQVFIGICALMRKPMLERALAHLLQMSRQFVMAVRTCLTELGHLNGWKFILLLVLLTNAN
jgi:hypothetical protein